MPVRIYDIAKRMGLPNKVVLEKAKELGITAARAASCSLDKITAEFLEQQLVPKKTEPPVERAENMTTPEVRKVEVTQSAESTSAEPETGNSEVKAELSSEEPKKYVPLKEEIVDNPDKKAEPEKEIPAEQTAKSLSGQERAEPVAETEDKQSANKPKTSDRIVPESVRKEVESFVMQGLEELSTGAKVQKPGPQNKGVKVRKPEKNPVIAQTSNNEKARGGSVKDHHFKGNIPHEKTLSSTHPSAEKQTSESIAPSSATVPPAKFEMKPLWKIPLSVIGKRLAEDKMQASAQNVVKEEEAKAPQGEEAKLGQKIGFIQLPQKPSSGAKQSERQNQQRAKDAKKAERDRSFKEKDRKFSQQSGGSFSGQTRSGGSQRGQQGNSQKSQNGIQSGRQQSLGGGKGNDRERKQQVSGGKSGAAKGDKKQVPYSAPVESTKDIPIELPANAELITMKSPVVVRQLAELLNRKPFQLIADLMELGVFANVNQSVDESVARKLCAKYGFRFELERREKGGALVKGDQKKVELVVEEDKPEDLQPRPPVVTIMGHVDHGKTTLLDAIRKSDVVSGEAGGITQHIGAYTISIPHPEKPSELQKITFLDTPGHEAFSAMRARGANVTDIVILVVAANDGVKPQTIEAIRHAQAANVTIIVAVNKCDHPAANPQRTRQQLQDYGLLCEEWGGQTIFVDISALTKKGIDTLLGMLVLQAEMLELKANPNRHAIGNVIESGLAPGGPTATVLVRKGTLRLGDVILCGEFYGKARALINEEGQRMKSATPSEAVKLLGLNGVPEAGTEFVVVENEKIAREMSEKERQRSRAEGSHENDKKLTLEGFLQNFEADAVKVLKVVVKGDTQGSVEAIVDALKKIESKKVSLEVIHSAVGTVTESDVILASASKAIVIGFHTRIDSSASDASRREGVQIKLYSIIYELIDQVRDAMAGLLDPIIKEEAQGEAEVRQVFNLSKAGSVAGCMIVHGQFVKGRCRVIRGKETIYEGTVQSLRHFQDEVNELKSGMECGIRIDGFHDYREKDIIQSYTISKIAQDL